MHFTLRSWKGRVTREGRTLGELGAGEVVGSALLIGGAVSDVDAVTVDPARMLQWDVTTLKRYLHAHPETRIVLQRHLARDFSGKLLRMGADLSKSHRPPRLKRPQGCKF